MNKNRIIAAVFLAPLLVIVVNVVMSIGLYFVTIQRPPPPDSLVWPDPSRPLLFIIETTALYSIYGVPTAFVTLVLLWLPAYYALRRLALVRPETILIISIILSLPAILLFDVIRAGWFLFGMLLVHGIAVGFGFLYLSGLRFSNGDGAQPDSDGNAEKPPGVERES